MESKNDLMDALAYPCFFLESDLSLRHANTFAQQTVPALCHDRALAERIEENSLARQNLLEGKGATVLLYDQPVTWRLLSLFPLECGFWASLTRPACDAVWSAKYAEALREPLSEIFATLPILDHHLEDTEGSGHLQCVNRSCYRLLRATEMLTSLSRLTEEAPSPECVELGNLVQSLCRAFADLSLPGLPAVRCILPQEPLYLSCAGDLLSVLVENLLSNALRFAPESPEITVAVKSLSGRALLQVTDAGPGIRPEVLPHVFDRYYSASVLAGGPAPGVGLGLSFVRALTRYLGGSITLESVCDRGTQVTVALPCSPQIENLQTYRASDYLSDRFSSLYVELHDFCHLPQL